MPFASLRPARMLAGSLATALLAAGLVVGATAPASAATAPVADPSYNVIDRTDSVVTADALPTVQIDGVVWDTVINGDTVYAGGQFANARPAGAASGTNLTPRSNLLAFSLKTGVMSTTWAPTVNGKVKAMGLSPDKTRLYVVGSFTTANGATRNRVAAFSTTDGSLVSTFAPNVNNDVSAIAVSNSAVYVGGVFTGVGGVTRSRVAAFNPTNGALLAWNPVVDATVNTMTLTPDGSRLVLGGIFTKVNGSTALGLASVDAANGTLYPFAANQTIQNYGNSAGIYSLKSDGTSVYGTAYWFGGTGNFEGIFVADPTTGAIKSMVDCHGDTYDATVSNDVIYGVSHEHDCRNINGFPDTNPRTRWQRANAFTLAATTTVGQNQAGGYGNFAGQPAPSMINWFPAVSVGSYTGQSQGGWTTESNGQYVVEGGEFPYVNNVGQQGLVRFAVPSLATNKQGPRVAAADSAPKLRGLTSSSVRVTWPSNWDRDNISLTYKLYRSDRPTTPILTQTQTSEFWNLPTQSFVDTGLTPGLTYGYWVVASDANGNSVKSTTTSVTAGASVVDQSAYAQAVTADGASHYWRLDEAAGETASTDWAGSNDLQLGTGVTNGANGAVKGSPDTAATFDGTANGTAGQTTTETGPQTFTAEAWFKTTSTSGGKILGFGDSQLGSSGSYDRHVYLDNAGHLTFGVYPYAVRSLTASGTYNDGAWHQVVASLSSSGMQLYVDGLLEGSDAGTTSAQPYTGYWRVGGDSYGGWPNSGSSQNLAGSIDDVSIYPTALSAAQVRNHYTQAGYKVNVPDAPADAYGRQVYNDSPSLYWRLDEAAGATTVADSSTSRTPGTAYNGVTFGTAAKVGPGTSATFDGSDDTLASNKTYDSPRNYSEEVWFNTTTTHGGKLIGFGNQQSGYSNNYDRHVYMENSGQLTFGVWTGQTNLITTPTAYNDGRWHHMVATQSTTDGMKLYVDGALQGTNGQTDAQGYTGYWRVGGDSDWGGDSAFLAGSLDEVAVYPYALTAGQVSNHYAASGLGGNAIPQAAFTSACTDLTCAFDGTTSTDADGTVASYAWSFGDQTTSTDPKPSHAYTAPGTYTVTLTVTDDKGATASTSKTVTVTAANVAPTAAVAASTKDLTVSVDGSGSSDPDGTVASYAWSYGDGGTGSGQTDSHTYAAAGTYTVTLTVTDDKGATGTVSTTVTVSPANVKPTARLTTSVSGLAVAVDGSTSTDSDGTVASYAWDYGDGGTGSGKTDSHTYAAAGTYTVKLTVTDDKGATDTATASVTVTAPTSNVVASDDFSRTGSRWGTADTGGAWTDSGASYFATSGGKGTVTVSKAGSGPVATLAGVSVQDSTTTTEFSLDKAPNGGGYYFGLGARKQGTSQYRLKVRVLSDGSVHLLTTSVVSGTETTLKESTVSGLTYTPGTVLKMRFDVAGTGTTTLTGKVWKSGSTEPASAQITSTSTVAGLQSPGAVEVQGYVSGSSTSVPTVASVDSYKVVRN